MLTPERIKELDELAGFDTPTPPPVSGAQLQNQNIGKQWGDELEKARSGALKNERMANRNIGEKVLDVTGGKEIAQGLGQALTMRRSNKMLEDTQKQQFEIQGRLIKQIKDKKAAGEDTSRLEKALSMLNEDVDYTADTAEEQLNPNGLTKKEVIGDAIQLGTTALAGSAVKGLKAGKVLKTPAVPGLDALAGKITGGGVGFLRGAGKGLITGATSGALVGAGQGAAQGLQDNEDASGIAKSAGKGALLGAATGGAIGTVAGGISGGVQASKIKNNPVNRAVNAVDPELGNKKLASAYQEVVTGKRKATSASIFDEQKLSPSEQIKGLGTRLKDVIKSDKPLKNLDSLGKELETTESKIEEAFSSSPDLQYNADKSTLFEKLHSIKSTIPREFSSIRDSKATFNDVVDFGQEVLDKADDNPAGLRNARTAFDNQAKLEYPNAFKEGAIDTKTPAGRAIKAVRDMFNEHLYTTAPNGSEIKRLIGHEADIFRASENIAQKAAKMHGETGLLQWMKNNPGKVKALGILGGLGALTGLGAGAKAVFAKE